ncbi:transcription elongation regulator 1-like [Rhizophagus clarus]|uniref:Transcription elongation regulator 1-like n=1 Tax=Rhizophagus clarus TaxID=94130 RepID=A0A8H3L7S8_9GLOM|nr:transcription elongation regulator 1-like [Rhizophagus clarus]
MSRSPREQDQPHSGFPQQRPPPVSPHQLPQLHMGPPFRPLLPSGWTEHRAPNGMFYYYNAATGQSTWERPILVPPPPPVGPPPGISVNMQLPSFQPISGVMPQQLQQNVPYTQQKDKSKDKKKKEKAKGKRQIPDTKWYIVNTTEGNEFYYNSETKQSVWEVPEEIAEAVKVFKEQEEKDAQNQRSNDSASLKRKANDEEVSGSEDFKRAKGSVDDGEVEGTELTEDDIAFQLQFMEEQEHQELMDGDSEDDNDKFDDPENAAGEEENSISKKQDKGKDVELSSEERVLMFKSLLKDMEVSPFAIWEKELPRIIHDERYTLIPTLKQRKEIFDEYCKERVTELRAEKKNKAKNLSEKDEYLKLLEEETTHRSHWDDFRRKFKRDPKFKNFSDDKEKEKIFRNHVKGLKEKESERKRAQQKKAEEDFIRLLKETREIKYNSSWRKVKRIIDHDPRKLEAEDEEEMAKKEDERRQRDRKAREEASLRNREAQVRWEKKVQNREKDNAKNKIMRDESIREFQTLLVDLVRTHETTWELKKPDLQRDPRFHGHGLEDKDRERLFQDHINDIYQKRLKSYHKLLDQHVQLDTTWLEIQSTIKEDLRSVRLSKNEKLLEELFDEYLIQRIEVAKKEFKELLRENQFVEYRTRMVKLSEDGATDETGTSKEKARALSLEEIHDVLKEDKRYLILNTMPDVRNELITEYLNNLETPKMTVHQGRE